MQTLGGGEASPGHGPGVRTAWKEAGGWDAVCRGVGPTSHRPDGQGRELGLVLSTDGKARRELSREVARLMF